MRLHSKLAAALSVMLMAGLVVVPATSAAAAAPVDGQVEVEYIIPTRHGKLFMAAIHPTKGGKIVKSPTILTYTPYSSLSQWRRCPLGSPGLHPRHRRRDRHRQLRWLLRLRRQA